MVTKYYCDAQLDEVYIIIVANRHVNYPSTSTSMDDFKWQVILVKVWIVLKVGWVIFLISTPSKHVMYYLNGVRSSMKSV